MPPLHRLATAAIFLATAAPAAYAEPADNYLYEPPINNNSISGNMLNNEAEFLTPAGIVDNMPEPDPATIEPAAGADNPTSYDQPAPQSPNYDLAGTSGTLPEDPSATEARAQQQHAEDMAKSRASVPARPLAPFNPAESLTRQPLL